jgi:hypothetical protein
LAVLLQLRDQLVALADNILVLFVLVVRSIGLNHAFAGHAINCAWYATAGNEFGKVTVSTGQ